MSSTLTKLRHVRHLSPVQDGDELIRIARRDPDAEVRFAATEKLDSSFEAQANALLRIALCDPSHHIRIAAIRRFDLEREDHADILGAIVRNDRDADVRVAALHLLDPHSIEQGNLIAEVADTDGDPYVVLEAIQRMVASNPLHSAMLEYFAERAECWRMRLEAALRLDPRRGAHADLLRQIAANDTHQDVREAAQHMLDSLPALAA
jgi:hypothetical protein